MNERKFSTVVIGIIALALTAVCAVAIFADIFKANYNAPDIVYYAPGTGLGLFISRQLLRRWQRRGGSGE